MCDESYTKVIIDRKKGIFYFLGYNHLLENMNWFSIHNFDVKVVLFVYAIWQKGFFKRFCSWKDKIYGIFLKYWSEEMKILKTYSGKICTNT